MSLPRIKSDLHGQVDELFAADLLHSTDAQNQTALKGFLSSAYCSLASLAWHLGADGRVSSARRGLRRTSSTTSSSPSTASASLAAAPMRGRRNDSLALIIPASSSEAPCDAG